MFVSSSSSAVSQPTGKFVFSKAKSQGNCVLGFIKGKKSYELLYAGSGIFLSTANITRASTLWYDNVEYNFQYYVPTAETMHGIVGVYYVKALEYVGAPVKLYNGKGITKSVECEFGSHKLRLQPAVFKGGDGYEGTLSNAIDEAKLYCVSKFKLPPRKHFDIEGFYNQGCVITTMNRDYPALVCYHKSVAHTRGNTHGSVRMFSRQMFCKTEWKRA